MRVLVADETGLLKSIELERNEQTIISNRNERQARARSIQRMCWYEDETVEQNDYDAVVLARANNVVESYSSKHGTATLNREVNWSFTTPSSGQCVGVGMLRQYGSVVHCTSEGNVMVKSTLSSAGKPSTFNIGADLERMRVEPREQMTIASGGKERDLNIWSLERQEVLFRAKNVPHDKLDMRVPVWVKDFRFLSQGNSNGHRVIVGTGYHQVRIYDTNTKRRPVQQIEFGEYPINAMCVSPDERQVYIADTTGNLDILDLRTLKHMGRCTGPVGAIRSVDCHPTLPFIAAVGLDRMVHVFDVNTRKYQHMIYAKQRLNEVLFCSEGIDEDALREAQEPAPKRRKHETNGDEEEDDDEDELEEVAYEGLEISEEEEVEGEDEDENEHDDDEDDEDIDSDA